jgi:hypothetical protein
MTKLCYNVRPQRASSGLLLAMEPKSWYSTLARLSKLWKIGGFFGVILGSFAIIALTWHGIIPSIAVRDQGTLKPAHEPMPEHWCNKLVANSFRIYFGDYLVVVHEFPNRVLSIASENMLILDRDIAGHIIIKSLTVFDGDQLTAKVDDHGWQAKSFKKTEDQSTLIVYNHDDEALRLQYLNPNAIRLSGIFQHPKSQTKVVVRPDSELNLPGTPVTSNCITRDRKYGADFNFP